MVKEMDNQKNSNKKVKQPQHKTYKKNIGGKIVNFDLDAPIEKFKDSENFGYPNQFGSNAEWERRKKELDNSEVGRPREREKINKGFSKPENIDALQKHDLSLFPIQIRIYKLPFDYKSMYYKFDKLKKPHYNDPIQASNYGLAAEENYILNQSPFKHLSELILECVRQYNFEILNYKVDRWKFTQSWLAYKSNGQEHKTHFHPNSIISGILFFHEEQDNSDVQYYNEICAHMPPTLFYENGEETEQFFVPLTDGPNNTLPRVPPTSQFNKYGRYFEMPYSPGQLILFPSTLFHGVPINTTNLIRKSLSMNIVPEYGVGDKDDMTELLF